MSILLLKHAALTLRVIKWCLVALGSLPIDAYLYPRCWLTLIKPDKKLRSWLLHSCFVFSHFALPVLFDVK